MSEKKHKNLVLANNPRSDFFRPVSHHPVLSDGGNVLVPKKWVKLVNGTSVLVFFHEKWMGSGYGALNTIVLHKWNIRKVLERAGVCGNYR